MAELIVHKRRSKKFYLKLKSETEEKADSKNVLALAFDYMQNVQLPKTPVGEIFYYQQLTVSVFCIHNLKNNQARMYIYHEGQAKKTANEICTFLMDYLKEFMKNEKELHIFSDNCWGQNKNHTVIRMLMSLTDCGLFEKIIHYFPVRGHSFLPCDRDFALVKKNLRKYDRISTVHQITELIVTSSTKKYDKFSVKEVETTDILDFKTWWPKLYKKTCISEESKKLPRNERVNFNISTFACFKYSSELKGQVQAYQYIDGLVSHTFILSQPGKTIASLVYPSPPPKHTLAAKSP